MSYLMTYSPAKNKHLMRRIMMLKTNGASYEGQLFKSGAGNYDYRHVRLQIDSPGGTMQFSNMFFETTDSAKYTYPDEFKCWVKYNTTIQSGKQENGIFFGSEKFSNVLNNTNSMNKVCCGRVSYTCPIYFYIDLQHKPLNIKRYCWWGWHTANDTTGPSGSWQRNMKEFSLYVSNADMDSGNIPEQDWQCVGTYQLSDYDRQYTYGTNLPKYAYAEVGPFRIQKQ